MPNTHPEYKPHQSVPLHFFLKQSNGVGSVVVVLQQDTEMVCSKIDLHNLCILIATAFEFCSSQFSSHV